MLVKKKKRKGSGKDVVRWSGQNPRVGVFVYICVYVGAELVHKDPLERTANTTAPAGPQLIRRLWRSC